MLRQGFRSAPSRSSGADNCRTLDGTDRPGSAPDSEVRGAAAARMDSDTPAEETPGQRPARGHASAVESPVTCPVAGPAADRTDTGELEAGTAAAGTAAAGTAAAGTAAAGTAVAGTAAADTSVVVVGA